MDRPAVAKVKDPGREQRIVLPPSVGYEKKERTPDANWVGLRPSDCEDATQGLEQRLLSHPDRRTLARLWGAIMPTRSALFLVGVRMFGFQMLFGVVCLESPAESGQYQFESRPVEPRD